MDRKPGSQRLSRAPAAEEVSAGGVVVHRGDPRGGNGVGRAASGHVVLLIRDSYRNWGFPKGHVEDGESPETAALREVAEETGLRALRILSPIDTIDWHFRFRGRPVHKTCHFFLMETDTTDTSPQLAEGISACRWESLADAAALVSYENARGLLVRVGGILETIGP